MIEIRKLYGEDVTTCRVLDKIELAARRAAEYAHGDTISPQSLMQIFADELIKINMKVGK